MFGTERVAAENRDYQRRLGRVLGRSHGYGARRRDLPQQRLGRRARTGAVRRAEERRVAARLRMNHYAEPLAIPGTRGQRMMHHLHSRRDLAWRDLARRMRRTLV